MTKTPKNNPLGHGLSPGGGQWVAALPAWDADAGSVLAAPVDIPIAEGKACAAQHGPGCGSSSGHGESLLSCWQPLLWNFPEAPVAAMPAQPCPAHLAQKPWGLQAITHREKHWRSALR